MKRGDKFIARWIDANAAQEGYKAYYANSKVTCIDTVFSVDAKYVKITEE